MNLASSSDAEIVYVFIECVFQDLLSVEARLDAEYGCHDDGEGDGGFEEDSLFCPACNKLFKSDKA